MSAFRRRLEPASGVLGNAPPPDSATRSDRIRRLVRQADQHATTVGPWLTLLVLVIVGTIVSGSFLTSHNLRNIGAQAAPLGMVALGQTIVIIAGGIDVSVGALVSLTTVVAARTMVDSNAMILPTVLLVLAIGLAVGLVNGALIARLKTDAFVTTFAMMLVVSGAALVYSQGSPANNLTSAFRTISQGTVLGVSVSVYAFALACAAVWFLLARTAWGRLVYAAGGNPRAAYLSARRVNLVTVGGYVACSLLAVIGGLFLVARLGTGDTNAGSGWELEAIAAVLVGGTPFGGGRGGVMGPVAGVLILTTLFNLTNLLSLPDYSQLIIRGAAVVIGVALYSRRSAR